MNQTYSLYAVTHGNIIHFEGEGGRGICIAKLSYFMAEKTWQVSARDTICISELSRILYKRLISKCNTFKNELIAHVSYKAWCILIANLRRARRTVSVFSPFAYPASEKRV